MRIEYVYWLCGALLAGCALHDLRARRFAAAAFWGILAVVFVGGETLPEQGVGIGVIVLALIAGSGALRRAPETTDASATARHASAERLGHALFAPALAIPLGTLALTLLQPYSPWAAMDRGQFTLIALGLACVFATIASLALTHAHPRHAIGEASRLLDALSWALLLPMLLAMLGAVFAATGVGDAITHLVAVAIPIDSRTACLFAFAFGMVAFTIIMGNAFAAFPVMMAGIGLPLLIGRHHAHAAALGALGMLIGYCGTLLTPMAANFNMVPAALLELRDPNAVIRAQWPTALALLAFNLAMLWFFSLP